MKRFYKIAQAVATNDGQYAVCVDGKPIKTPSRNVLASPFKGIADVVAKEWDSQGEMLDVDGMPLTKLLNTAVDKISVDRRVYIDALMGFFDTDLVCYRAEKPPELVEMQKAAWDAPLEWFRGRLGSEMETTEGLKALAQPEKTREALQQVLADMDYTMLTVFQLIATTSGSLVLSMAFCEGFIGAEELFCAIHVEENYKAGIYMEDFYGKAPQQELREKEIREDIDAASVFLSCIKNQ